MPWIIDKDNLVELARVQGKNRVGVMGPFDYKGDGTELTHKFRMLDDDFVVIYEGRAHKEHSFGPLDDFGMPDAGCTMIEYFINGEWVQT